MQKRINTRTAVGGALAALSLICGLSTSSMADWDHRGGDMHGGPHGGSHGGWHDHAREAHEWRRAHWRDGRYNNMNGPYETYAPPVVVEPPPAYYPDEDSGVNLVFPLNIH
jgi:hypothetical protein